MKWIRNFLKGASLTTALFIFQACYGTYEGPYVDDFFNISFKVVSDEDGAPLKDVEVSLRSAIGDADGWYSFGLTDQDGCITPDAGFYSDSTPEFRFLDTKDVFETKDTTFRQVRPDLIEIKLKKKAE